MLLILVLKGSSGSALIVVCVYLYYVVLIIILSLWRLRFEQDLSLVVEIELVNQIIYVGILPLHYVIFYGLARNHAFSIFVYFCDRSLRALDKDEFSVSRCMIVLWFKDLHCWLLLLKQFSKNCCECEYVHNVLSLLSVLILLQW